MIFALIRRFVFGWLMLRILRRLAGRSSQSGPPRR